MKRTQKNHTPSSRFKFQGESPGQTSTARIQARKEFSQNFLTDQNILQRMEEVVMDALRASAASGSPPPYAVEVGPGMGALTRRLLRHVAVHAIEKDARAVDYLRQHLGTGAETEKILGPGLHQLNVTQGDILGFDPTLLAQQLPPGITSQPGDKPLLVGNLPYAISSEFLLWYCRAPHAFRAGHFLLQKEVVERLVAPVGSKSYGRLGVLISLSFRTTVHFDVPPEAFEPRPSVTSSFFSMEPILALGNDHNASPQLMDVFQRCTAELFSRRRKMLRKSLEHLFTLFEIPYDAHRDAVVTLLETFGISPEDRPERIPPQGFLALARFLLNHGAKHRPMDRNTEEAEENP